MTIALPCSVDSSGSMKSANGGRTASTSFFMKYSELENGKLFFFGRDILFTNCFQSVVDCLFDL